MFIWRWWRALRQNPIYLREKGAWGRPNPFYTKLSQYSPLIVLAGLIVGACTGFANPAFYAGNDTFFLFWCLVCFPIMLLNAVTLYGSFMAPALTAPAISLEVDKGTWDILRTTPMSVHSILLAKLFGGLARLRIWPILFALSLLQGAIIICGATFNGGELAIPFFFLGVASTTRPWLEILFAAFTGMYLSTWLRSATTAVSATYLIVIAVRLFNSTLSWTVVATIATISLEDVVLTISIGPTVTYAFIVLGLAIGIVHRARYV